MTQAGDAQTEEMRLIKTLGWFSGGGLIEQVSPLGVCDLPGEPDDTPLRLGISTWPFPPEKPLMDALAGLGYVPADPSPDETLVRLVRPPDGAQLLVAEAGSTAWGDARLLHEYAAAAPDARARILELPLGDAPADLLADATHWWLDAVGFAPLRAAMEEMKEYSLPWAIAGGWAFDLGLGAATRVHHDVDIMIDRNDQFALRELLEARGYGFVTPLHGILEPWPRHMRIELPRHQLHAHRQNDFLDILLTDFDGGCWRYRRDTNIVRTRERALRRTEDGLPYLAPELGLLFKSRNTSNRPRPKDKADFERVFPRLDAEARAWLRWALVATEPDHPWLQLL